MAADQFEVNSLKQLARQFTTADENSQPKKKKPKNTKPVKSKAPEPDLPLIEQKSELDEYHEFPRLEKFKTYEFGDVKKPTKSIPVRETVLNCTNCDVTIHLKDCELYESTGGNNLRPIFLKNSHAFFEGLQTCDSMTFMQDQLGNFLLTVVALEGSETINLGCIVKFEFYRPAYSNLTISAREIDGDIAVVGTACSIEFLVEQKCRQQDAEAAGIKRLNTSKNKVHDENKRAGEFTWNI